MSTDQIKSLHNSRKTLLLVILLCVFGYILIDQLFIQAKSVSGNFAHLEYVFKEHNDGVWSVAFSPNDSLLASSSADGTVKIWRREDGLVVQNFVHPYGVPAMAFSSVEEQVATGSYDGIIRIWDVAEGRLSREFDGKSGTIWGLTYSPDGMSIAFGGQNGSVMLVDLNSSKMIALEGHNGRDVWSLAYRPDGTQIASAGHDNSIKIWNLPESTLRTSIDGHKQAIVSIAYSPDGKILASGSDDKTVKLWDTRDWSLLKSFSGETECVYGVAFSPDGQTLISGSRDKKAFGEFLQYHFGYSSAENGITLRIWDVDSGELLQTMNEHADDVNFIAYSHNGAFMASASADTQVNIWRLKQ